MKIVRKENSVTFEFDASDTFQKNWDKGNKRVKKLKTILYASDLPGSTAVVTVVILQCGTHCRGSGTPPFDYVFLFH